jgi:hypothetical protein
MKLRLLSVAATIAAAWSVISAQEVDEGLGQRPVPNVGELPEIAEPAEAYRARRQSTRAALPCEDRVTAALDWLADHQASDGSWSTFKFHEHSVRAQATRTYNIEFHMPGDEKGDLGWNEATAPIVGLTGLCLMAYTAAGYDHKTGAYAVTVRRALDYLLKQQSDQGSFVKPAHERFTYDQATATTALADIYGLTGDVALKQPLLRACDCIIAAQNPCMAWRYEPQQGINDSHCTAYMMLALSRAQQAGLKLDMKAVHSGVTKWFDLMCVKVGDEWKTGYDAPGSNNARLRSAQEFPHNEIMDAAHGMVRMWMGEKLENEKPVVKVKVKKKDKQPKPGNLVKAMRESVLRSPETPRWEALRVDLQFWFWASFFLKALGPEDWAFWRTPMDEVLIEHQRGFCEHDALSLNTPEVLDEHGSWDAVTCWSSAGGRAYTTAMGAILLCVDLQ